MLILLSEDQVSFPGWGILLAEKWGFLLAGHSRLTKKREQQA